jgi:hypothetical protein
LGQFRIGKQCDRWGDSALVSEVLEHKHEAAQLHEDIKNQDLYREEQVASMKVDHERILKERDNEIKNLLATIIQCRSLAQSKIGSKSKLLK